METDQITGQIPDVNEIGSATLFVRKMQLGRRLMEWNQ
jgi:hypothetical protein